MRPGGGRSKGHGFENQVAKLFSTWWGVEKSFVRCPGSGAWGKLSKFAGTAPAADLVTPDEFSFTIECKKDQSTELHHLLINSDGCSIAEWLKKLVEEDCVISKKKPMLIFSKNNWKIYCIIKYEDYINLKIETINFRWKEWVIFLLEDFLKMVTKENV